MMLSAVVVCDGITDPFDQLDLFSPDDGHWEYSAIASLQLLHRQNHEMIAACTRGRP